MAHELSAVCVLAAKLAAKEVFQFLLVSRGHTVPDLGGTIVQIVDRVEIHVLSVPAEEPNSQNMTKALDSPRV